MNDVFLLYLFTRADSFKEASGVLATISLLLGAIFGIVSIFSKMDQITYKKENDPELSFLVKIGKSFFKWSIVCFVLFFSSCTLLPTKQDLAIIVGGSYIIDAAKSDKAKEIGGLVYDAIVKQLKEATK